MKCELPRSNVSDFIQSGSSHFTSGHILNMNGFAAGGMFQRLFSDGDSLGTCCHSSTDVHVVVSVFGGQLLSGDRRHHTAPTAARASPSRWDNSTSLWAATQPVSCTSDAAEPASLETELPKCAASAARPIGTSA